MPKQRNVRQKSTEIPLSGESMMDTGVTPVDFWVCRGHNQQKPSWRLWCQAIQFPHTKYYLRSLGPGTGERKGTILHGCDGQYSIKLHL